MAEKKFTNELKQAFDYIQNTILKEYETDKISTEYFILSILSNDFTVGYKVLSKIMLNETFNMMIYLKNQLMMRVFWHLSKSQI